MARPAKSIATNSRHNTKKEVEGRKKAEKKLKGGADKLMPAEYLTETQKAIYGYIVENLKQAEILGNVDHYLLNFTAVTIDAIIELDKELNYGREEMSFGEWGLLKSKLIVTRGNLMKDFFRCCNELSLSPQARAKISIANVKAVTETKNPLMEALSL